MIICHSKRFIFFSNPKTGSESIRSMLRVHNEAPIVPYRQHNAAQPFYPHMPPAEAKRVFDAKGWSYESYRRITCVRNPYTRLVSLFKMIQSADRLTCGMRRLHFPTRSFLGWLQRTSSAGKGGGGWPHQRWRKFGTWSIQNWTQDAQGNSLVNDIIKLETMERALPEILESIGVIGPKMIPHNNKSHVTDHRGYFDTASVDLVARRYDWDIKNFNYKFEAI